MRNKGGRPTKLTPELQEEICKIIRAGNYIETAAAYVGISKNTIYDWMRRGAREKERLKKNPRAKMKKSEAPFVEFSDSIEKALAYAEVRDVAIIGKAAETQWQAAAWRLERKFRDRWGRNDFKDHEKLEIQLEKAKLEIQLLEERIKQMKGESKDTSLLEALVDTVTKKEEDE